MIIQFVKRGWRSIVAIFLFIVFWESAVGFFDIAEWFLPAPSVIVQELFTVWPTFYPHLLSTLTLAVFGFVIGALFGLGVAMVLHLFDRVRETVYPFLILSQNIPIIVLAPLLVIWFGFGTLPKFLIITLACFFPIAISTLSGLQQTNRELAHYMLMMGASKREMFMKLELPDAVPAMISGLKIAATYSVMAAVVSEWLGAQKGIGVFMTIATSSYKTPRVFVAIIVTMCLSFMFFTCISLVEKALKRFMERGAA